MRIKIKATAAVFAKPSKLGAVGNYADERTGIATIGKKQIRKVFLDYWSFMLGEIALWSFVVLLLTGVFFTLWFKLSMAEVIYDGFYEQYRGFYMSEAYVLTLDISFDVRGGLLMRQIHHWSAMLFIASMFVHLMRVFLTGVFCKPRELNWLIGGLLLLLGILEGFAGYSLFDDLFSGIGLRIVDGLVKAILVVGIYMSFFMFGGEFFGDVIILRFYIAHVLLILGLLLVLIGAYMMLLVYQKHIQWFGFGRTEENVVGYSMMLIYAAKAGGFFFIVFGVTTLMGGLFSINLVWKYGPYNPAEVTAGSQSDWYMGVAEGLLRIFPGWETEILGVIISWNVMLLGQILLIVILMGVLSYSFIEAWIIGDKREHHLLQRPRNAPNCIVFLVAMMIFYGLLWAAGGNDIFAVLFNLDFNMITYFMRGAVFVLFPLAFIFARCWCISLQRFDEDRFFYGYETGVIMRSLEGAYAEWYLPISNDAAYALTVREREVVYQVLVETDSNGVARRKVALMKLRSRLSHAWFGSNIQKPIREELAAVQHYAQYELYQIDPDGHQHLPVGGYLGEHELDGHSVDGHQYDGRYQVVGEELCKY